MAGASRQILHNHDFLRQLDITIEDKQRGEVRLSLPHREPLTDPRSDAMQGGVVSTLIDFTGGTAIRTMLNEPLETPHATANLEVTYVRPAVGDLTATGDVVRVGGSLGVVSIEVASETADGECTAAVGTVSKHITRD